MMIKNWKHAELNTKLKTLFLITQTLKMITNVDVVTKIINKSFKKS